MNDVILGTARSLLMLAAGIGALAGLLFADTERFYPWIKALHLIAIISWMAGLLYLPRLFVYHTQAPLGSPQSETFKVMEERLLRFIMGPAMVASWILGLWLAWRGFDFLGVWLHMKIAAVVVLSAFHSYLAVSVRRFATDRNTTPERRWRLLNEVPTLLLIIIVVLVVVKPF